MNQLIINSRADADIDTEALFIAEEFEAQRGDRFYDACETTFNNLLNYPQYKTNLPLSQLPKSVVLAVNGRYFIFIL